MKKRKTNCPHCGARLKWSKTISNNAVPLDAAPTEKGDMVIIDGYCYSAGCHSIARFYSGVAYTQHAATCPAKESV